MKSGTCFHFGRTRVVERCGRGLADPLARRLRGGGWNNNPDNARFANRNRNLNTNEDNDAGFRVASTPPCQSSRGHGRRRRTEGAFRVCHVEKGCCDLKAVQLRHPL